MTKTISEEEQLGNYIKTANEFAESKKKSFGHFSDKWEWLITRIYLESKQAGQSQALDWVEKEIVRFFEEEAWSLAHIDAWSNRDELLNNLRQLIKQRNK